tara:strand:- start:901 stop:1521 length:621 start_codon:yes stop_codon:yes gene_type:complete
MGLNELFDEVYCVNLDERTDRWEQAQIEFGKLGLSGVNRFSAIKHEKGAIGCRESHLGIIKKAKEKKLKNVLIFEDDVLIVEDNIKHLNNALEQLKNQEWDLFYLGATVDPNVGRLQVQTPNLVKTNFAYTTHAYAVNHTMYDFILKEAPYQPIIDVFYNTHIVPRQKSFIINPMLCIQQEGYSNIENQHADYEWMLRFFNNALKK